MLFRKNVEMVTEADALPGRTDQTMPVPEAHFVNGHPLVGPWPEGMAVAVFGMGCFWGVERKYWQLEGVYSTFVGYAGGFTPNPTYEEVCSGRTGHTEAVAVVYDPSVVTYERLLQTFWEEHDPTQGMRQGNDIGTQYRSVVFLTDPEQADAYGASKVMFQERLNAAGYGEITTEVIPLDVDTQFFYAEPYHQQYLAKNPNGYCGVGGTGVSCPIGVAGLDS
jgi:peptide-methionine (S)-S-oxide reductase